MGDKSSNNEGEVTVDQGIFVEEPAVAESFRQKLIMNGYQALVVLEFIGTIKSFPSTPSEHTYQQKKYTCSFRNYS